jgi:hypothetical protein
MILEDKNASANSAPLRDKKTKIMDNLENLAWPNVQRRHQQSQYSDYCGLALKTVQRH